MLPKKKLIDKAEAKGAIDRMNMLLSFAHVLNWIANNAVEEASDLMKDNGLLLGEIKQKHSAYLRAADVYFNEFAGMIKTNKDKMDMFRDIDYLEDKLRKWGKLK